MEVSKELTEPYFTYGSNMDEAQIRRRVGDADAVGIGFLDDYELVFNRQGTYRPGGVASVEFRPGARTYGTVWNISSSGLLRLDEIEDPKAYRRELMLVTLLNGTQKQCYVYVSYPEGEISPDPEYLDLIIEAARRVGLPNSYIEKLERFRRC